MYLLFNLMSRVTEIRSNAKGTTYPEISKGRFREMEVIVPSKTLVNEFAMFASNIIQQVRRLKQSMLKFQAARDLLLPRLMNGEVAV
jgi:type I restriction enzyme S subunit